MTLRVTLEIVPFGIEENKRTIYTLNISNMGSKTKGGKTRYRMLLEPPLSDPVKLLHIRGDGAVKLARKALQWLEPLGGN